MHSSFKQKSWLITTLSCLIICIVVSYWFMQYQLFIQYRQSKDINNFNLSNNKYTTKIQAGEKAKLIFSNQSQLANNIKLMGIVQDTKNKNNSYILLKVNDKSFIYHLGQNIPNLGILTSIENQKISIKNSNTANTNTNSDVNLQYIYLEKPIKNSNINLALDKTSNNFNTQEFSSKENNNLLNINNSVQKPPIFQEKEISNLPIQNSNN